LRVIERVGGGAFASVWRAHDETLDTPVALKFLSDSWLSSADIRRRFVAEAELLRRAASDRVVRVYDIGELPDGRPYFVMSYADRGTLDDRLAAGPLPWRVAVQAGIEICEALRALHAAGVLHRDIKPSNVLFRSVPGGGEQLLLGDLGLGKLLSEASGITLAAGTLGYMAPEQARAGGPIGKPTDIYGVGAVLYRSITGYSTVDAASLSLADADQTTFAPLHRLVAGVPPVLTGIVQRALANDPSERQPDADSLLTDLRGVLGTQVYDDPPRSPAPAAARPLASRPRRRRLAALLAAPVVASGVVAAVTLWPGPTVEVRDDTDAIVLRVPRDWAKQVAGRAWNPVQLVGRAGTQPAVLVAASVAGYTDATDDRPGVFIGLLSSGTQVTTEMFRTRVRRADCLPADPPVLADARTVLRDWCGGVVIDDVLLARAGQLAWVQVKQPVGRASNTQEVVASVRLHIHDR